MRRTLLLLSAFCLLTTGCEQPFVDPFEAKARFSVYGFLDPWESEHFVRVVPVRRFPEQILSPTDPHAEIDAVVQSTNLTNGEKTKWIHELVQLNDGSYGHIFSSKFVVHVGHTYQISIRRSDGVESTAETTVPRLRDPSVAVVEGDSAALSITWAQVTTPQEIVMSYCVREVGAFRCNRIPVAYGRDGEPTENGWTLRLELGRDLLFVRQQLGLPDSVTLELTEAEISIEALDESWSVPVGDMDLQEFAQPGALSNVENGFGFWGSVARSSSLITLPNILLEPHGYVSRDAAGS